ncbi:putative divergent polysaccharide deacetylase [Rhodovastum atsumiense]|nr:putative divergent polysaccharide deacetylase [Rhodovastum atsumiense]
MVNRGNASGSDQRPWAWIILGWFWVVILACLIGGGIALQVLGPPTPTAPRMPLAGPDRPRPSQAGAPGPSSPATSPAPPVSAAAIAIPSQPATGRGGLAPADMALLEPGPEDGILPRIGPDGRMPMQVYAAPFDPTDPRPRVAVLLGGIGMAEMDSEEAIRATPPAISLAISPYAARPARLQEMARAAGHETLISIPMEPAGYPLDDPGNRALLTGLPAAQNQERLLWALSRIAGYVGATGSNNGLRGERFAASGQMPQVLNELARRGVLYIDARPTAARTTAAPQDRRPGLRAVDVTIDDPPVRAEIEAKLSRLEQISRDRGAAIGLASLPGPVTVERLAAWAAKLPGRGVVLVPVSALVSPLPLPTETRR